MTKREIFVGVVAAVALHGPGGRWEPTRLIAQQPGVSPHGEVASQAASGKLSHRSEVTAEDARMVSIPVVAYDKKGELVKNLTLDNFALEVDKKPRQIHSFHQAAEQPLTLGLIVDTSLSQHDVIDDERNGSTSFLTDMLADRDKAFVIQFARQVDLLQDTTGSKALLQAGLKQLATDAGSGEPARDRASVSDGKDTRTNAEGRKQTRTALYDALFLSSDELMSKQAGRKTVIILSNGVDSGSKESLGSAIEAAQRADVVVYAIYYKGREVSHVFGGREDGPQIGYPGGGGGGYLGGGGYPGGGYPGSGGGYPGGGGGQQRPMEAPRPDGRKTLERIANETGGRLFEVNKKATLAGIYKEIADELRAQYRLIYLPDKETGSGGYHRVVLTPKPKELYLQTRDGYFGPE